jgi:hypothetical protein
LERDSTDPGARESLRLGVVMDGGVVQLDRPIVLRVRQPSYRVARQIEYRLDEYFQDSSVAAAVDDGVIRLNMPAQFNGDWEHFRGVVSHVFFNSAPQFATLKAHQLADQAVQPDAPLLNISYAWEGLGSNALPFVLPLMTHANGDVAFAAARAAALLGDTSALNVLGDMARNPTHPFRLNAVQTLASLPPSPVINGVLRTLLSADQNTVRLEAYRALARAQDSIIVSAMIRDRFVIDHVDSNGPPMIYAARLGTPRIALFGRKAKLNLPITFTARNGRLSISSSPGRETVTIFYRGRELPKPIKIESNPDIAEIAARLGGMGPPGETPLNFSYGEIVAILQAICDEQQVTALAAAANGAPRMPVTFVLQDVPLLENSVYGAPVILEPTRPAGEEDPAATQPTAADDPGTGPRQEARR